MLPRFFLFFFFLKSLLFLSRPPPDYVTAHLWVGAGLELAVAAGNSQTLGDSRRRLNFSHRSRRRWAGECGSLACLAFFGLSLALKSPEFAPTRGSFLVRAFEAEVFLCPTSAVCSLNKLSAAKKTSVSSYAVSQRFVGDM